MFGGATLSWLSKTPVCVTVSSAEAECVLLVHETKLCFVRMLPEFMRPELPRILANVSEDDEEAIKLASKDIWANKTKHIGVRH